MHGFASLPQPRRSFVCVLSFSVTKWLLPVGLKLKHIKLYKKVLLKTLIFPHKAPSLI